LVLAASELQPLGPAADRLLCLRLLLVAVFADSGYRGHRAHLLQRVALIARLAVIGGHQGTGLGRSLLLDALQRILNASEELAIRAVTVARLSGGSQRACILTSIDDRSRAQRAAAPSRSAAVGHGIQEATP
jgi:GNAT superfamily N-acetyltransferase